LGVKPIVEEAEDRSFDIFKGHFLGLFLLEEATEGSGEERQIVSNNVLVNAKLLRVKFANEYSDEGLCLAGSVLKC
jgi:hypothetical protein